MSKTCPTAPEAELTDSPFENPRQFIESVVRPSADDFHRNFQSIRHALTAVWATDALMAVRYRWAADFPFEELLCICTDGRFRQHLAQRCEEVRLIRDIANAAKHVNLTRYDPFVSNANQIVTSAIGYCDGPFGMELYGGPPQVVVKNDEGELIFVEGVVDRTIDFLVGELSSLESRIE